MMIQKPLYKKSVLSFLFLLISFFSFTQDKPRVKVTVDKNRIVIGEQIKLTIEANIPKEQPLIFFTIDTIQHFEILQKNKIDTSFFEKNTMLTQSFTITSFDSGQWVIPEYIFSKNKKIKTDSITIDVGFAPFDPNKEYNDIKDIIEVEPVESEENWYWYIIVAGIILATIIYFLTRKKKKPEPIIEPIVNPYQQAMQELQKLEKEKLPAKGELKLFYTRLVDIFRLYVFRKKHMQSLHRTTDDLVVQLHSIGLTNEKYNELSQVLRLSDFVKFAKYLPVDEDNRAAFSTIKNSIKEIEKTSKKLNAV